MKYTKRPNFIFFIINMAGKRYKYSQIVLLLSVLWLSTYCNYITKVEVFILQLVSLLIYNGQCYEQSIVNGEMMCPYDLMVDSMM